MTRPRCVSCLAVDGVEHEGVMGVEVDEWSGLCLYCQPCPKCGEFGTACWDDGARIQCYGTPPLARNRDGAELCGECTTEGDTDCVGACLAPSDPRYRPRR